MFLRPTPWRRSFISMLVLATALVSIPALADLPPGGTFTDDDGSIHEPDIEAVAAADITRGCNPPWNDRFCPTENLTRGEMAAFLVRALDLPAGPDRFSDDEASVFEADIDALAAAGITRGCNPPEESRFCPNRTLSRGEMAAFLTRAYDYEGGQSDRFTDDDGSIFENDIAALADAGVTLGCNPPANDRFCPTASVTRQQMASFLARAEGLRGEQPPTRPRVGFDLVTTDLVQPVYAVAPPGDDRIFVVEKGGTISVVEGSSVRAVPVLDIASKVANRGEMGMLSMAFHPDFPTDDRIFVYYNNDDSGLETRVSSFRMDVATAAVDAASETTIIRVDQPATNHNGGHLVFDEDGYLLIPLGDGGQSNDPNGNGQNRETLLGAILRIDVDSATPYGVPSDNPFVGGPGRDEIWAVGVRNPWRVWVDSGLLYVADVGQGAREEVTVVDADRPLVNFGWSRFEGTSCNRDDTDPSCASAGFEFPDVEYGHDQGCSITGGVVYRGQDLHWLQGHYFYGDLCQGWVRSFRTADGEQIDDETDWDVPGLGTLWSFGVDGQGELLIVSGNGALFRMQAR